ncbi:hypothetical protein [Variovorax sp. KBW07]|uniref:hypothetical protein n=1 Tax=Variovorax sp. KBW07 TaxID=2153358 RepID=UPI0021AABF3C|nr:hypothetical protein [Variovorax sp. KBW07]
MNARPRIFRAATATVPVALLLLLVSGCSHYHIGIPLVPGLSLGLGATKDGNFSMGLNTGFGPLGAGVAVNNGGVVSGSAGVGVGVGVGPVGTGVGVGKSVVLHDPKAGAGAATATGATAATVSEPAGPVAAAAGAAPAAPAAAAPVTVTKAGVTRPATSSAASPSTQQPVPVRVSYRPSATAAAPVGAGTPGQPVGP